jgi:ribonuclease BN (tRNA processing enzyme)
MGLLIDMIDVGQGDSFLLTIDVPGGGEAFILIDAGLPTAGPKIIKYLQTYAPTGLDMLFATHIDQDHVGGLAAVLEHGKFKQKAEFVMNVPPRIKNHWSPGRGTLEKYKGVVSFKKLIDAVDAVKTLSALLRRRHIKVDQIKCIGKESNSLESVEEGTAHSDVNVYTDYADPKRTEWITKIQPALRKPSLQLLAKICEKRISRRELIELRAGRSKPHRKNQELLESILKKLGFL